MTQGLSQELQAQDDRQTRRCGAWEPPDDVAHAVKFLVSDEAGFITGHVLDVNGGIYM